MTVEEIFELAMALMDSVSENGVVDEDIAMEYRGKTPSILTTLQAEIIGEINRKRDITDRIEPVRLVEMQQTLQIDNVIAQAVLPYGLASNWCLHENKENAIAFQSKYDELKFKYIKSEPVSFEDVVDVYDASCNF